jgi:Mrp family chromosome partitioning ATPase
VPTVARRQLRRSALAPPPTVSEAFRTLQIQIDQRRSERGHPSSTIVVTSPSSGDGKTTTAICLAAALVAAGHDVVLLDCDLRRPDIGKRLGLRGSDGLERLLSTEATLDQMLLSVDGMPSLRVLHAAGGAGAVANMHALTRRAADILGEAAALAEYVVVDTAPLGVVGDALALAPYADELLLVGRAHNSDRRAVENTVALLERANTPPAGWVMIGDGRVRDDAYHYADSDDARRSRSPVG